MAGSDRTRSEPATDREAHIRRLVDDLRRRREQGEVVSDESVIAAHFTTPNRMTCVVDRLLGKDMSEGFLTGKSEETQNCLETPKNTKQNNPKTVGAVVPLTDNRYLATALLSGVVVVVYGRHVHVRACVRMSTVVEQVR